MLYIQLEMIIRKLIWWINSASALQMSIWFFVWVNLMPILNDSESFQPNIILWPQSIKYKSYIRRNAECRMQNAPTPLTNNFFCTSASITPVIIQSYLASLLDNLPYLKTSTSIQSTLDSGVRLTSISFELILFIFYFILFIRSLCALQWHVVADECVGLPAYYRTSTYSTR